ncbi:MAG: aldose 1-epimerase family protein [Ruminococcaceae bacterium]|nr:aldose 1-epimerase family protein [Oscillospiraceae bacterium]
MAYFELENNKLRIRVCSVGAELQSVYSKELEMEYIWQPGAETFAHHTMLLFPNPGRIAHDRIIVGGKVYPATMHGFANDMEFRLVEHSANKILLELAATDYTRRYFPYEFRLQVVFTLKDDVVEQNFYVINDDRKAVYYCLGAHPGFYCPIVLGESGDDYSLVFDTPQNLDREVLEAHTRLLTGNTTPALVGETEIPLDEHFFDDGPRLYCNMNANTITLLSNRSGHFMELGVAGFENLCLWGAPGKMSVICIEPWCGTSDRTDTDHIWENKPGIRRIEVGETGHHKLTFRVG